MAQWVINIFHIKKLKDCHFIDIELKDALIPEIDEVCPSFVSYIPVAGIITTFISFYQFMTIDFSSGILTKIGKITIRNLLGLK